MMAKSEDFAKFVQQTVIKMFRHQITGVRYLYTILYPKSTQMQCNHILLTLLIKNANSADGL